MKSYGILIKSITLLFICFVHINLCYANSVPSANQSQNEGLSANPWKKRNKVQKRRKLLYNEHVQKYDANARDLQIEQMQAQTQAILQRNAEAREAEIRKQKELEEQNKKNNDNSSDGFDMLNLITPEIKTVEKNEEKQQKQNIKAENKASMFDEIMKEYNKTTKKVSKIKNKATGYYNKVKGYTKKSIRDINNMFK